MELNINQYEEGLKGAVKSFWATRSAQSAKQKAKKASDQGDRSSVTGGAQMDGFADLVDVAFGGNANREGAVRSDDSVVSGDLAIAGVGDAGFDAVADIVVDRKSVV
jgi:hypothetical protein